MIGLVNTPGYDIISNHRKNFKGGGTAILIKKGIPYKRRQDLDVMIEKTSRIRLYRDNYKGRTSSDNW